MNKFSAMSGQKVNDAPDLITNKEVVKLEALKAGISNLIDNFLTIRAYGSARRNILENTVKISGKEMFIEVYDKINNIVDKNFPINTKPISFAPSLSLTKYSNWSFVTWSLNKITELLLLPLCGFSKNQLPVFA